MNQFPKTHGSFEIIEEDDKKVEFSSENLVSMSNERKGNMIPSMCIFKDPICRIVTGDGGGTIKIYDSSSNFKLIKTIDRAHTNFIFDMIKMGESTFLSGSSDDIVKLYSIYEPFAKLKEIRIGQNVRKLLKVSKDLFICRTTQNGLFLIDIEQTQIIRKFIVGRLQDTCLFNLILSKRFKNSFYIPVQTEIKGEDFNHHKIQSIFLIDWNEGILLKEFENSQYTKKRKKAINYTISLFENSRKEEIVVTHGDYNDIYYYNTSSSEFDKNLKICGEEEEEDGTTNFAEKYSKIYASCVLNNQYLCCGDSTGGFYIYDFMGDGKLRVRIHKHVDYKGFFYNLYEYERNNAKDICELVYCTGYKDIRMISISGLEFRNSYEDSDEVERILFLRQCLDSYIFNETERKSILVKIRLYNFEVDYFPKNFLL